MYCFIIDKCREPLFQPGRIITKLFYSNTEDYFLRFYTIDKLNSYRYSEDTSSIAIVTFLNDSDVFDLDKYMYNGSILDHGQPCRMIISEKYSLFSVNTLKKFDIHISHKYIFEVCRQRNFPVLEYLFKNNKLDGYEKTVLNVIKDVEVLTWFAQTGLKLECDTETFDTICCHYNADVLEWVLIWLLSNNMPIKYSENAIDNASKYGNIDTLKLLVKFNIPFKYSSCAIDGAVTNGYIDVLNWWINDSGLPLKYDKSVIDIASENGDIDIIKLWLDSELPRVYSEKAIDAASENGDIHVLQWWIESGLELKYSSDALDNASYNFRIDVLDWWFNSKLPLKYSDDVVSNEYFCAHLKYDRSWSDSVRKATEVINWWRNSGLPFKDL
jgi:hypothetical protein